ncbi:unnamed protein product [Clonostachys solani]|uniref:Uncharacterized protein n=1 Tax=Clonostachys solani TaxID=160281 RepID=A0A9N9ZJW0_9HYPO|nr:unnamed protein product [Clonostachys solani]
MRIHLTIIKSIFTGYGLKKKCCIPNTGAHWSNVVQNWLTADYTGVWDKAKCGLQAHQAAKGCWNSNGSPLIGTQAHINLHWHAVVVE